MLGLDRHLGQNGQAHACGDRGLNAGKARRGIGHMPAPPGAFQRMDRAGAIEAAAGKADQRHGADLQIDRMGFAGDPVHALGPRRDAALLAGVALEQREVELAAFQIAPENQALVGSHVKPQARTLARARRQ